MHHGQLWCLLDTAWLDVDRLQNYESTRLGYIFIAICVPTVGIDLSICHSELCHQGIKVRGKCKMLELLPKTEVRANYPMGTNTLYIENSYHFSELSFGFILHL